VTRDKHLGMTGWTVEVEGWSLVAMGTTDSSVLTEDLRVLPQVA
jgi:hypothetical protein